MRKLTRERLYAAILLDGGRGRETTQACLDSLGWCAALTFGVFVRQDFDPANVDPGGLGSALLLAVALHLGLSSALGLYRRRWRYGSFEEVAALVRAGLAVTGVLFVVTNVVRPPPIPRGSALAGGVSALVLMAGTRYLWRLLSEHLHRPSATAARLLVFGAGGGGDQIVTAMLRDPNSPYLPVALLDDDPAKRHLRIRSVPVVGTRADIADAARRLEADTLLIAVPSAGSQLIRELSRVAVDAGLAVKVLPPMTGLIDSGLEVRDIRPLTEEDLLGRHVIDTDVESIAKYLKGKRVLVTGAGGSIGSELCRQLHRCAPSALIMLDRDESALLDVQLSIDGHCRLDSDELVLADIRDAERVRQVFVTHEPEVVFHAAAFKHVPILEQHPTEAVKTNVFGTLNVLEAAQSVGVERFVNISTDKAADPVNVLGFTKRVCERLTAWFSEQNGGTYLSVRFGNVLGSRGSMLQTFRKQIAAGGPVTVTHPEVTRYFMTVEEAVQLVIQAGALGRDGEVLMLDMGYTVRVAEVAERLCTQSDRRIAITFTGLRPGEKLHEVLLGRNEIGRRGPHPRISHAQAPPLWPDELDRISVIRSREALVSELRRLGEHAGEPASVTDGQVGPAPEEVAYRE